jgi:hypothetical protein
MIEKDVYKTVLQWAGWALSRPFLHIYLFCSKERKKSRSRSACACSEAGYNSQNGDSA